MIHLQSLKPFTIHPKPLIDKHIKLLKSLSESVDFNDYIITMNAKRQPVLILNKAVNTGGSVGLQLRLMRSGHMGNPISVARSNENIIVYVAAIPMPIKLSSLTSVGMEKLKNNVKNIINGVFSDEISMIAHEATHMIDLAKHVGKYDEGKETLAENFEDNNWLEINATLNQVVYCFPQAVDSYDKFVECFMDEDINYEVQDKKDTFYTKIFKPAVESILSNNLG